MSLDLSSIKNNRLLILLECYSKVCKNFIKKHWALIFVFSVIVFLILFAAGHTLSGSTADVAFSSKLYVLFCWGSAMVLSYYVFPEIESDQLFLHSNFTSNEVRVVKACKGLALCSFLYFLFSGTLWGFGLINFKFFILGLPLIIFSSLFAFYPKKDPGKKTSKIYSSRALFRSEAPSKALSLKAILFLNKTYLVRFYSGRLLFGGVQFVIINALVVLYVTNKGVTYESLHFLLPFVLPLLGVLDINSTTIAELRRYTSSYLLRSFFVEYFLWMSVLLFLWCSLATTLLFLRVGNFADFTPALAIFPFVLLFVLSVKFKFLKSRFMRSFGFGMSLFIPIMFPIILVLLIKDFFDDRN